MNKAIPIFTSIILTIMIASCSKSLPAECDLFDNWKIISEKEKSNTCNYQQIYLYNDEYYSICECCTCDKIDIPVNCNGDLFCEIEDMCMPEFYSNAEYLYSAVTD